MPDPLLEQQQAIRRWRRMVVCLVASSAVLIGVTRTSSDNDPCAGVDCGVCGTCVDGNCVDKCATNQACCAGACYDPAQCLTCSNNNVVTTCTDLCYPNCDGNGNCLYKCATNELCCAGECYDPMQCKTCSEGTVVTTCPPGTSCDGFGCCEGGPHHSATNCCLEGSVSNPGTLSFTIRTNCIGQGVFAPAIIGTEVSGGITCYTVTYDCPSSPPPAVVSNSVSYGPYVYWEPEIPAVFTAAGTHAFTAKVKACPSDPTYCSTNGPVDIGTFTVITVGVVISGGDSPFCVGKTNTLSASGGLGTYTWSSGNPGVAQVLDPTAGNIVGVSAGTAGITATDSATGCSTTKVVTVIGIEWGDWQPAVNPSLTNLSATAGPRTCVGTPSTASFSYGSYCGKKTRTDLNNCTSEVQTQDWCFSSVTVTWVATDSGGSTVASGTGASASFTAPSPGNYGVTFTATGMATDPDYSTSQSASTTVEVIGPAWGPWQVASFPGFSAAAVTPGPPVCVGGNSTASFTYTPACGVQTRVDTNNCTSQVQSQQWCFSSYNVWWVATDLAHNELTNGTGSSASFVAPGPGEYIVWFTVAGTAPSNPDYYGFRSASTNVWVYGVSISPSTFTTFIGASNTFIATGIPDGATYHDWSPAGTVSADGRTNTVAFPTLTTNQTVSVQYGPGCSITVTGAVVGLVLSNVTFSVAHNILRDDGSGAYAPPHWTATNSYPVTYPRNTTGAVSATFWVVPTNCPVSGSVIIRGDGSGGLNIPATTCTVASAITVMLPATKFASAFPNQVDFLNPLTINWKYTGAGSTFYDAGASANPVYITLTNPVTTVYHTLVHLGCANAVGQTTSNGTADAIYNEFADRVVRRVSDNKQMTYWYNDQMGAVDTAGILQRSDANGNCQAWSGLFRDCLRVQGINADRIRALPTSGNDDSILVKDWQFNDPPSGSGSHPYVIGTDAVDLAGIPGQGNPDPPGGFNGHWITLFDNQYYDPSYGTAKVTGANRDKAYEDGALAGYGAGSGARKNDVSTNTPSELNYQLDN
jgi:hypothetical protein